MVEDPIRKPDISKSIQKFQLATEVRLDLAVSPGTYLIPSNTLLNTQSTLFAINVVKGFDEIQVDIPSQELADETLSNYKNGKRFIYEHVGHLKTISVNKRSDTIINKGINVPRRSMQGLLLFCEPYVAGARDGEKTFNPDIAQEKVIVNGIPNKVYSQGMETRDMW